MLLKSSRNSYRERQKILSKRSSQNSAIRSSSASRSSISWGKSRPTIYNLFFYSPFRAFQVYTANEMPQRIVNMVQMGVIGIRDGSNVYSDLILKTTLLRVFLSFHPVWLHLGMETGRHYFILFSYFCFSLRQSHQHPWRVIVPLRYDEIHQHLPLLRSRYLENEEVRHRNGETTGHTGRASGSSSPFPDKILSILLLCGNVQNARYHTQRSESIRQEGAIQGGNFLSVIQNFVCRALVMYSPRLAERSFLLQELPWLKPSRSWDSLRNTNR